MLFEVNQGHYNIAEVFSGVKRKLKRKIKYKRGLWFKDGKWYLNKPK